MAPTDTAPSADSETAQAVRYLSERFKEYVDLRTEEQKKTDKANQKIYNTIIMGQKRTTDSFKANMKDLLEDNLGNKSKIFEAIDAQGDDLTEAEKKEKKKVVSLLYKEVLGKKIFQGMGTALKNISNTIQNLGNIFMPMIMKAMGLVLAMAIFDPQGTILRSLLGIIINLVSTVLNFIIKQLPWVINNIITVLTETLPGILSDLIDIVYPAIASMFNTITDTLINNPKTKGIGEFLQTIGEMLGSPQLIGALKTLARNLPQLILAMVGISVLGKILGIFIPIGTALLSFGKFILPALKGIGKSGVFKKIVYEIQFKLLQVVDLFGKVIVTKVTKIIGFIAKKGLNAIPVIGWILLALEVLSKADFIMNIFDFLMKKFEDFTKWAFSSIEKQLTGILAIFKPVVWFVESIIKWVQLMAKSSGVVLILSLFRTGGVRKLIQSIAKTFLSLPIFRIFKGGTGIFSAVKSIKNIPGIVLKKIGEFLTNLFDKIWTSLKEFFIGLGFRVKDNIDDVIDMIKTTFDMIPDIISRSFTVEKFNKAFGQTRVNRVQSSLSRSMANSTGLMGRSIVGGGTVLSKEEIVGGALRGSGDLATEMGIEYKSSTKDSAELLHAALTKIEEAKKKGDFETAMAEQDRIRVLEIYLAAAGEDRKKQQEALIRAMHANKEEVSKVVKNTTPKADTPPTFDLSGLRLKHDF